MEVLTGELQAQYASRVQGLLFGLDELNQSLMLSFRSIYMVYESDPCSNGGFFQRGMERLVAEQQRISLLRIQVRALIELAKNHPGETQRILAVFREVAGSIGGHPAVEAAVMEIQEERKLAQEWSNR